MWAAKPNRKGNQEAGKRFWQRSRYGSLSAHTSLLLLPLPSVPPSDPSPCSDMPQFHFSYRNASPPKGWIEKNAAKELEPVPAQLCEHHIAPSLHTHPSSAQPGPRPLQREGKSSSLQWGMGPGHLKGCTKGWDFRPAHPGWVYPFQTSKMRRWW